MNLSFQKIAEVIAFEKEMEAAVVRGDPPAVTARDCARAVSLTFDAYRTAGESLPEQTRRPAAPISAA